MSINIKKKALNVKNGDTYDNFDMFFLGDVGEAVDDWFEEHPDAVTNVADNSITAAKLAPAVRESVEEVTDLKSAIIGSHKGIGYFNEYGVFQHGAIIDGVLNPNYSYRVSTDTIIHVDAPLTIKIKDGFRIILYYFVNSEYTNNSGYVTNTYSIPEDSNFKIEIRRTSDQEEIVEANIYEFVHAVSFDTPLAGVINGYYNGLSIKLDAVETFEGYFKLNSTPLTASSDINTLKFIIPTGATKIYIKTRFFGITGIAFSDIEDTASYPLSYPANCTKDPINAYVSLTNHEKTYTLDRYYKCVYVPYYTRYEVPTVIAYKESAFKTFWEGIRPLDGKNVLIFGDSITYTPLRWRQEFFRLTRAKELACISYPGAHLTDYRADVPLDGNYATTADGGVHNVVCNQVYYWLNTLPTDVPPDIIIISAATNDVQSIAQLETDINVYTNADGWIDVDDIERTSFEGAMRWIVSKLRQQYPYSVIVFASPIQSAQEIHTMEYQLAKEKKMEKICERLGVNLIKATSRSGITGEFEIANSNGRFLIDGLHPNEYGGIVLGTYYANKLENIYKALPRH